MIKNILTLISIIVLIQIPLNASSKVINSSKTCFLRLKSCSRQHISTHQLKDREIEFSKDGCKRFLKDCQKYIFGICDMLKGDGYECDLQKNVENNFIERLKSDEQLKEKAIKALNIKTDCKVEALKTQKIIKNPFPEYDYKSIKIEEQKKPSRSISFGI